MSLSMVSHALSTSVNSPIMQLHCMWPKCSTSSAGSGTRFTLLICLRLAAASGRFSAGVAEDECDDSAG